jgi:hypothetical protein
MKLLMTLAVALGLQGCVSSQPVHGAGIVGKGGDQ